jgi:hypothetical protein
MIWSRGYRGALAASELADGAGPPAPLARHRAAMVGKRSSHYVLRVRDFGATDFLICQDSIEPEFPASLTGDQRTKRAMASYFLYS